MENTQKTIAEWRQDKGISREALAAALDVSVPTIYAWEKKPGRIRIDYAYKIARELGVELKQIQFCE